MRTETIVKTVYTYAEMSDEAKEAARDWFKDGAAQDFDYECIYEDATTVAKILGIDLDQKQVPLMNGTTRPEPKIWFSGFCFQGSGACFEGSYAYAKGASKAIRSHAPQDEELHAIADALQALQKPFFYRLEATCNHSGRYYHSGCMSVCAGVADCGFHDVSEDTENTLTDVLRSFADWIYARLEAEYEYQTSDEYAQEGIEANEYEFNEDGTFY